MGILDAASGYLLRLVCGAMVCGLILSLTGTGSPAGRLRQLLCGLFLGFLALSPLRELDLNRFPSWELPAMSQGESYIQAGQNQAREAMERIITQQCRAYILNKAESLGLTPEVEVELDPETGSPAGVRLTCQAAPYEKAVLIDCLMEELGIERSRIQWIP